MILIKKLIWLGVLCISIAGCNTAPPLVKNSSSQEIFKKEEPLTEEKSAKSNDSQYSSENIQETWPWQKIAEHEPYASGYGDETFFKSKGQVYVYLPADPGPGEADEGHKAVKLKNADANAFEINEIDITYGRDKKNVYFQDKIVAGADPETFTLVQTDKSYYAQDKNSIYFENKKIKNADHSSFKPLEYPYSEDKNHTYFEEKPILGADLKSWEIVYETFPSPSNGIVYGRTASSYSKDKQNVYYKDEKLKGFDPKSFKVLPAVAGDYTEDKNGIYYERKKIEGVDMASFKILENDGEYMLIRNDYAKDKNHVYYQGKLLPGVNPSTFTKARESSND